MTTVNKIFKTMPGIAITTALAIPAYYFGLLVPLIGGPVFGILLGMTAALWQRPCIYDAGITFASKKILQASIVLVGFEMNLYHVLEVGSQSIYVIFFTLSAAFITAYGVGRYLKIADHIRILIGVGTAICGGSAIAATAPVISASHKDIAYSISTIFLFNIVAVFVFPFTGHLLGMSDIGFGMWAGTAINDTSSVVAAGYTYSHAAGNFATIVKLTRTLMIIPITLALAIVTAKKNAQHSEFSLLNIFPWFVLGFLLASLASTLGLLDPAATRILAQAGKFFIVIALVAIGLNTHLKQLISNGSNPIILGLSCWLAVALASLATQHYLALW